MPDIIKARNSLRNIYWSPDIQLFIWDSFVVFSGSDTEYFYNVGYIVSPLFTLDEPIIEPIIHTFNKSILSKWFTT